MTLYRNGSALIGDKLVKADIAVNHGKIIEIAPEIVADEQTEVVDCTNRYILPALVDIHTHGANGYDFNTADLDGMKKIMEFYIAHGVGTVLPTVMTDTDEVICRQVALICELAKEYPEVKGINLEGPFLSPAKHGAMPVECLQPPSYEKFLTYQRAANGFIRLVTVAPELPNAKEFIAEATANGVVVSLGHSAAHAEDVRAGLEAGARSFTHWGNAMSQMDRLDLNMMGTALATNAFSEVICDGKHVNRDVLKLLVDVKGTDKVIGITDSMMAAGMPDGNYTLGKQQVTVAHGDAFVTGTDNRAGSILDAYEGLANVVTFCGLPLHTAIKLWTTNPAKLVGLDKRIGTIEVGKDGDFILFG